MIVTLHAFNTIIDFVLFVILHQCSIRTFIGATGDHAIPFIFLVIHFRYTIEIPSTYLLQLLHMFGKLTVGRLCSSTPCKFHERCFQVEHDGFDLTFVLAF